MGLEPDDDGQETFVESESEQVTLADVHVSVLFWMTAFFVSIRCYLRGDVLYAHFSLFAFVKQRVSSRKIKC